MTERAHAGQLSHSLVARVRAVPGLSSLGDELLLELVGDSANLAWRAGRTVLERGSAPDALYVVLSGAVRVLDGEGGELARLGPGDHFGEFSLLLGQPRQHDVVAAEDCELLVVPKECFDRTVAADPELGPRIREQAEQRMRENTRESLVPP
ncbi:MAG: cyclic nucleotide-binding domain-containing protein [Thermoleophilia bacterium]|nr:cyclic nucleotide-binding domain-containing protein [Thermoleophilia bacterium]